MAQEQPGPAVAPDSSPVVLAAGDIARCSLIAGAAATARLLDRLPGTILTLGDHAYESGTPREFETCYAPTWGRHLDRTRPAPGNHDYGTRNAAGYFAYFGERAGPPGRGYYSFDLGTWHIVSLNSAIPVGPRSPQGRWLAADLRDARQRLRAGLLPYPRFQLRSAREQSRHDGALARSSRLEAWTWR